MASEQKTVLVVFGTRPEVIKLAPIVRTLKESGSFKSVSCATGQHREILDQTLRVFEITPDFKLDLMQNNQSLFELTASCLTALKDVYEKVKPDLCLVQGDTTTAMAASLAAFYCKIPVGHVEAGLRTFDRFSPYPEEMNRKLIGALADMHFAPTRRAFENLVSEGIKQNTVFEVGNTVIDSLLWAKSRAEIPRDIKKTYDGKKMILLTMHRRESFGEPMKNILRTIADFASQQPGFQIVYPVHPNPNVQQAAKSILGGIPNVSLIAPVGYGESIRLLSDCQFVMTDSGGLQEEAPSLGKPVLILRETTERQEAVDSGAAKLVGHNVKKISEQMRLLADTNSFEFKSMARVVYPFGDGTASKKILAILEDKLLGTQKKAA